MKIMGTTRYFKMEAFKRRMSVGNNLFSPLNTNLHGNKKFSLLFRSSLVSLKKSKNYKVL